MVHKGQLSEETLTDAASEAAAVSPVPPVNSETEHVDTADEPAEGEGPGTQQPEPTMSPSSPPDADAGEEDLLFIPPSLRRDKPEEQSEPAGSGGDDVDKWLRGHS